MRLCIPHIFLFTLLLSSCNVAEPMFIANNDLTFQQVDSTGVQFSIATHVYNPTPYTYELKTLFFNIGYKDNPIGSGELIHSQSVTSKDTIVLPLQCQLSMAELQKRHKQMLAHDSIYLDFNGQAFAVHPLKKIRKDFNVTIAFATQNFISENMLGNALEIDNLGLRQLSPFSYQNPTQSSFGITLGFFNKQPFGFTIKNVELSLKPKGTKRIVMSGHLDTPIDAPSLQTIKIPLSMTSHNINLLKDLGRFILGNGNSNYEGTGTITLDLKGYDFEIPFQKEFNLLPPPFGQIRIDHGPFRRNTRAFPTKNSLKTNY